MSAISSIGGSMAPIMTGASPSMPPQQKMSNLFDSIDTSGSGSITQSDFTQAFQNLNPSRPFKLAGADAVWSALDTSKSGSVSKSQFVSGMTSLMQSLREASANGSLQSAAQTAQGSLAALGNLGRNVNTQS
jgi:Ca2+-binding EF-hand superfamily protein